MSQYCLLPVFQALGPLLEGMTPTKLCVFSFFILHIHLLSFFFCESCIKQANKISKINKYIFPKIIGVKHLIIWFGWNLYVSLAKLMMWLHVPILHKFSLWICYRQRSLGKLPQRKKWHWPNTIKPKEQIVLRSTEQIISREFIRHRRLENSLFIRLNSPANGVR